MGKREKLIQRILSGQSIDFKDAEKILTDIGYTSEYPQGGSSHKTFRKEGREKITLVSYQRPIKQYALKLVQQALINEGYKNEK